MELRRSVIDNAGPSKERGGDVVAHVKSTDLRTLDRLLDTMNLDTYLRLTPVDQVERAKVGRALERMEGGGSRHENNDLSIRSSSVNF